MERLASLCCGCQGSVHGGDLLLAVDEDGTLRARDRDGRVVGKPQSAAQVLAGAGEGSPLETIVRRELPRADGAPGGVPGADPPAPHGADDAALAAPSRTPLYRSIDDLPGELSAAEWRRLEEWLEWSPGQRAFVFRPLGDGALAEVLDSFEGGPETLGDPAESGAVTPAAPSACAGSARAVLSPATFDDFVGQSRVVDNLRLSAEAARARSEPLGHVLLSGQPGLGKTTVARLLARSMAGETPAGVCGAGLHEILAGNIRDPHALVSLLARLQKGSFLFVDEVHRLEKASEECLYPALEEGVVHATLQERGRTRVLRVRLEPFTLVAATTCPGALSEPFRSRFPLQERLEYYGEGELAEVVVRGAARLGTEASGRAAEEVARRSKGTPREAIRILRRARDVAQVSAAAGIGVVHVGHAGAADHPVAHVVQLKAAGIDLAHVVQAAERLGIDENGLDRVEQAVVKLLVERGRPVGVEALAGRVGVDRETFRAVHEPWLERSGLIERTERGRVATEEARKLYGSEARVWRSARGGAPRGIPGRHGIPILRLRLRS